MVRTLARKYPVTWNPEHPISAPVLNSLLDDMGIGVNGTPLEAEAREATRQYCVDAILQASHLGIHVRIGYIERMARAFYDGYLACCMKHTARP